MTESAPDQQSKDSPARLQIHYLKSPLYRTVHVDGIIGGVTPHLNIHMSFWNERSPIPQLIECGLSEDGKIEPEIVSARIGKSGLVREVDIGVVVDIDTAIAFREWLDEKIKILKDAIEDHPREQK